MLARPSPDEPGAREADALAAWMVARRYRPRTVADARTAVMRLAALRREGWSRVPAAVASWLEPTVRRLEAAALSTNDPELGALATHGRNMLPTPDPHARFRGVAARRPRREREARALDDDAWSALCGALEHGVDPPTRVLRVMAATGLRVGDVLRITRAAALEGLRSGRIPLELKGGRRWVVPLEGAPEAWRALLEALVRSRAPDVAHYVAPRLRTDPRVVGASGAYQAVRRTLQRVCADLGVREDVWTHRIRRTVGVLAYRQTTDVLAVRDLLGHASPKTTLVYLDEARVDRAAELQQKLAARR